MSDATETNATTERQPPRFLPPHALVLAVAVELVLAWRFGQSGSTDLRMAGSVLLIVGIALAAEGSRRFRQVGTNIVPFTPASALVTDGVFAWSRNPMYLGMLIALTGVATVTATIWSLLVVAAFFVFVRQRFVLPEEAQMRATFGDSYDDYSQRVRRWL